MNSRLVPLLSTLGWSALLALAPDALRAAVPPPNGPGGALSFNVGNEYLDVPDAVWFSGDFTVEGWVYVRSHNNWSRLLDFGNGEGLDNVLVALSDGTTGKPHFHVVSDTVIGPGITTPNELPLNQWTHLACVLSGTTGTIYVNGIAVTNGPLNRPRAVLRTGCYLGRSNWAADAYANAIFDEVRIWSVARSAAQILEAMRRQLFGNESGLIACYRLDEGSGPSAFDATGNVNNTATRVNGSVWLSSSIVPFAPPVTTLAASAVAATSATLNGEVDGRTSLGTFEAYFQWGTTPSLGNELRLGFTVTPGAAPQNYSLPLTGLSPGATYYFRAVAVNTHGPSFGAIRIIRPPTTNVVFNNNDSGAGSLRQVLQDSGAGDTIIFAPEVAGTITLTGGQITIDKNLTIDASALPKGVTISGNHASRILLINSPGPVTLRSLTLTRGSSQDVGGAVFLVGGSLSLEKCVVMANSAASTGGGIYAVDSVTVINSTVSGNSASLGGGIYALGPFTLTNSTVSANSAAIGGGIYAATSFIIVSSTVAGNSASSQGGGICFLPGSATATVVNSTIAQNTAGISGGGIFDQGSTPFPVPPSMTIENSIVAGNNAAGGDPDVGIADGFTSIGVNIIGGNHRLAPLGFYGGPTQTMPPLPYSPAIDRGLASTHTPTTDQRGGRRVVDLPTVPNDTGGTGLDIGAVEIGGDLRIVELLYSGTGTTVSFTTESGWPHHLESKDALAPGPWAIVPNSTRTGNGTVLTVPDTRPSVPQRFYRAVMTP